MTLPSLILSLCLLLSPPTGGQLVIAGGNISNETIYSEFIKLAGENARVAVITTAAPINRPYILEKWEKMAVSIVNVCDDDPFPDEATAIWISGGDQSVLEKIYIGTAFEKKLMDFYYRGGIIGGSSAGSAFMSRVMIKADSENGPILGVGLDLLPQAIIDQHFNARNRLSRLKDAVSKHPKLIGVGIDENTAIVYDGRKGIVKVIGEANVTILSNGIITKMSNGENFSFENPHSRQQAHVSTKP